MKKNTIAYIAPFATWIGLQTFLPSTAAAYAIRSAATVLVLLWSLARVRETESRDVSAHRFNIPSLFMGLTGGLVVLALWVLPEFSSFYCKWCVWPIGSLPTASAEPSPYDPAVCGKWLTVAKLIGSAFVIAPVEELFFRSFLYRWLQNQDFEKTSLSRFDLPALLWTVFLFTLEHNRPLAAALCAMIYGLLAIRFGIGSAIVAHVTTNFTLALYVIMCGRWDFW